jgi:hypothetical protein
VARILKIALGSAAEVTVWDESVFQLGSSTLEELLEAVDRYDFAVFVFAPDDVSRVREKTVASVRDNVIFELGLFMGRLGRHRTFWVVPSGERRRKVDIPSDLAGITHASFLSAPSARAASIEKTCRQIVAYVSRQGRRTDTLYDELTQPRVLCAASEQWAQYEFGKDVKVLKAAFPGRVDVHSKLRDTIELARLLQGERFPIVHLVCYADKRSGDLVMGPVQWVDGQPSIGPDVPRLRPEVLASLREAGKVKLVVLATCDSIAMAAQLSRVTNVVASTTEISGDDVERWAGLFYDQLSQGKPLSQAFEFSKGPTNIPLSLMLKRDLRIVA